MSLTQENNPVTVSVVDSNRVRVVTVGTQGLSGASGTSGTSGIAQLPLGTLTVSPQTLPAGGGNVAIAWTTQFTDTFTVWSDSTSIGSGGSGTFETITTTTIYALELTNAYGTVLYKVVATVLP